MSIRPFTGQNEVVTVAASTTSAAFAFTRDCFEVKIAVSDDVIGFIVWSNTVTPTAVKATCTDIIGKGIQVVSKPKGFLYGAIILASGTTNVYLCPGDGF